MSFNDQIISIIGAPNLAENPLTVITAGSQDPFATLQRLKSRKPSYFYQTISTDPLVSWLNFNMSAITNTDLRIGGIAFVNHNLYNLSINSGVDWAILPKATYRIRADSHIIPHHLLPVNIIGQVNYLGNVTYLQDNPAIKTTSNWLTSIAAGTNTLLQVGFSSVFTNLPSGTQYFDIRFRTNGNSALPPQIRVSLYNSGVLQSVLTTTTLPGSGLAGSEGVISVPWNNTFGLSGNSVQVRIEGLSNSGISNVDIGGVMFRTNVSTFNDTGWMSIPLPCIPLSYMKILNLYIASFFENTTTDLPHVLFEWNDTLPVTTYHLFGTAVIGKKLSPNEQIDWGSGQQSVEDGSAVIESASGSETYSSGLMKRKRKMRLVLNNIVEDTWLKNFWGPILTLKGSSGVFFASLDPTQPNRVNEKGIYGRIVTNPEGLPSGIISPPGSETGQIAYQTTLDIKEVI